VAGSLSRRRLLQGAAAGPLYWILPRPPLIGAPFPIRLRKSHPYESLFASIQPGHDEFAGEKDAVEITAHLDRLLQTRQLPLTGTFRGLSPLPAHYERVADDIARAKFDAKDTRFSEGLAKWVDSLGSVRSARFYVLPRDRVRYEIASSSQGKLQYRVGTWKQTWEKGSLARFEPVEETLVTSSRTLFQDVTSQVFGSTDSFGQQLLRGVPFWRARLDSACGIDVYGNNGIAVGDIDGDGRDEVYVCQPGGLPNRLYKNRGDGTMEDITERAGVGILDDTTCALFLDLKNIGRQDLVVATMHAPLLFLNQGDGTFRHKPDAFRFENPAQGTFTGMAAADYDGDGRLDLYLCTYIYFQSEDQYKYPVPYYDSENGPPNFLFHNELTAEGTGFFQDVTARTGINQNNDRYSFAPAWCDFDGDGWPDLYVANDFGRNNLYRNEHGRFRDVASETGVDDVGPGMSAAWFDYDGDSRPDLYVSNMWTACGQRVVEDAQFAAASNGELRDAYRKHAKGNSLYRNRGDGTFESTGSAESVEMGRWAWGSDGIDFDNDGAPEIYVTCGMLTKSSEEDLMSFFWRQVVSRSPAKNVAAPAYENGWNALNHLIRGDYSWSGREPNVLYARRSKRFYDYSGVSGIDCADDSRAFAVTDFDDDGNLDLLLKSRLGPQVRAFQNHWGRGRKAIAFELRGTRSNRDAIGASVEIQHSGKRCVRTLQAGSGYLSQHTKRLHFGIGDSTSANIIVRWPSGTQQKFDNLAVGFRHRLVEGSNEVTRTAFRPPTAFAANGPVLNADNRPGLDQAWLLHPVPLPERRQGPGFLCLYAGSKPAYPAEVPFQALDVAAAPSDVAALYGLFRMYLFDYRGALTLPLLLLYDENGQAHKVYQNIPPAGALRADLAALKDPNRVPRALPFKGRYYSEAKRNYFRLGAAFYWAGYPEQALIYLQEAIHNAPENSKAHLAVGHIHLEAGRHEQARKHLEKALAVNPDSADGWINLGSLEAAQDNHVAALRDFDRALALVPDSTFALVSAGREHGKLGHAEAGRQMLERALEIEPQNAEAANQLGLLLAAQDRRAEAAEFFRRAIASQRDHSGAINNLGVLYMQMQRPNDAIAAFRYGIQVAPDEEILYLNLSRAYMATGEPAKARDILQQLAQRRPDSAMAKKGLAELMKP
jgi:tetratricopeptide (TPR) repeat protein